MMVLLMGWARLELKPNCGLEVPHERVSPFLCLGFLTVKENKGRDVLSLSLVKSKERTSTKVEDDGVE